MERMGKEKKILTNQLNYRWIKGAGMLKTCRLHSTQFISNAIKYPICANGVCIRSHFIVFVVEIIYSVLLYWFGILLRRCGFQTSNYLMKHQTTIKPKKKFFSFKMLPTKKKNEDKVQWSLSTDYDKLSWNQ